MDPRDVRSTLISRQATASYTQHELAEALRQAGLRRGDVVFSHSNVGYFGYPAEGRSPKAVAETILGALWEVIGEEGTLVVPTFTYSFAIGQPFDPDETPSTCGLLTEYLRRLPTAFRSEDPIFSVAAVGARARELTANVPQECFGKDSFWDRLLQADGIICNLNFDAGSAFLHYVERCLCVPYRYDKLFAGTVVRRGERRSGAAIYFCRDLSNAETAPAFEPFDALARANGLARSVPVGRGAIVAIRASAAFHLLETELPRNPWLLTVSARTREAPILVGRSEAKHVDVALPRPASMRQMVDALWKLPRDLLSHGYDCALEAVARQIDMTVHEFPTGTRCWTWIVPEKWTCHEAYLARLDGERIFSYADHFLHVPSYSLPFEGEVSREELFEHLHVHPKIPTALPFKFFYYERDWGLCCSQKQKESLTDDRYRVAIRTTFSYGALKVGEAVARGRSRATIVLCAHLCHPAMANDDLSGVAVGVAVMRELQRRSELRYTYRLLIGPETIGSVAYLSHSEELIPDFRGGLFLEALGLEHPHALQLPFDEGSEVAVCFSLAMKERDSGGWVGPFRGIIGNDERQFNAPGVRVPMLSLSRVLPPSHPDWPYREYHSSEDTVERVSERSLQDSYELVLQMIHTLESNLIPVNKFRGEVFLSRYGLHVDWHRDPAGHRVLFDVMNLVDGTRSVAEIARACGLQFSSVKRITDQLVKHGLAEYRDPLDLANG